MIEPRLQRVRACIVAAACGVLLIGAPGSMRAQDYPTRTVRFIVPYVPGGGVDFVGRTVAQKLSETWGYSVIVDNRPGGGTNIGSELVARAAPDGYTLLIGGVPNTVNVTLYPKLSYDLIRDFAPVILLDTAPNVLAVHPLVPAKSVRELIALAKARPRELNYASGAPGSTAHLAAELFTRMAGIAMVWVPYKDNGPGMMSMIAGETQVMFKDAAGVEPQMKAGRVRALAVTSAQPSPLFPGLPTVAAAGVPGYEALTIDAVLVPAKTPAAIISRLNQEIVRALNEANAKQTLFNSGVVVVGSSPEELGIFLKSSVAKWGKVIKDSGIRVN